MTIIYYFIRDFEISRRHHFSDLSSWFAVQWFTCTTSLILVYFCRIHVMLCIDGIFSCFFHNGCTCLKDSFCGSDLYDHVVSMLFLMTLSIQNYSKFSFQYHFTILSWSSRWRSKLWMELLFCFETSRTKFLRMWMAMVGWEML